MTLVKRGKVQLKQTNKKYITPTPTYIPPKESKIGEPGSIDLDGIWIPNNFYGKYNQSKSYRQEQIQKPEEGKQVTPLCRSLYSGKRYLSKAGSKAAECIFKKLCSNEKYINFFKQMLDGTFNVSPRTRRAIRRYIDFVYHTGNRRCTSSKYIKNPVEDYLTVDGVVRIKKVLKERINLLPEVQQIPSGVVLMRDLERSERVGEDDCEGEIQVGYIEEDTNEDYNEQDIQEIFKDMSDKDLEEIMDAIEEIEIEDQDRES